MRPYEVMAIFEATTEPTVIQGVLDHALEVIRTNGGNPGAIDRWGKRTFAYEVNHKREGYYVVVEFTGEPETVAALDRMLGLADEVVRHKVVRLPDKAAAAGGGRLTERSRHGDGQQRDPGGERHPRPRAALHQHRPGQRHLRAGGQPALAEPPDPGVGGGDLLLRRGVLARDGRERERDHHPGRAGHGGRPARAAQLGDPGGRPALQGRGGGGRDRPVAALGHRADHQERAPRPRARGRRAAAPARPAPAPAPAPQPAADAGGGYGFDEEPF